MIDPAVPTRWVMRSLNGSRWATMNEYTRDEAMSFSLSVPVERINPYSDKLILPGTIKKHSMWGS